MPISMNLQATREGVPVPDSPMRVCVCVCVGKREREERREGWGVGGEGRREEGGVLVGIE
jgi:hypothetical protein